VQKKLRDAASAALQYSQPSAAPVQFFICSYFPVRSCGLTTSRSKQVVPRLQAAETHKSAPVAGRNKSQRQCVYLLRRVGVSCVIEMFETADFFEQRITECRSSAAQCRNKNDREFWLKMVARWEGLLKTRQSGEGALVRPTRLGSLLARRAAKRRRAA
jgi:hypothetical protein